MCLSNHVFQCLEEFSPQTSPSGIIYPIVGVTSMCPPPPINLWQYSTLHPHPHTHSEPSCTATFGRCKRANWELGLQNALHYSVSKGVIQRKERGPVKCNLQFK